MKAVILDMYGVIIKEPGEGFVEYVQQFFPELSEAEIVEPWFKADVGELSSLKVWKKLGFKGDLEEIEKEYLDTLEINECFYDFAEKTKKEYKLGLISNDSSRWSKYLRDKFDLNKYFDAISISGDLKVQKPDEKIYTRTLEILQVEPSESIYVDDREFNLEAAERLGMDYILFNGRKVVYQGRSVEDFGSLWKVIKTQ